jgi:hypothetical protein
MMNIYKYNHYSLSFSLVLSLVLSLMLSFVFSLMVSLVDSLVLHLPKLDLLDLKVQVLEQLAEYDLVVGDGFSVRLIEVDPDLDAVAH